MGTLECSCTFVVGRIGHPEDQTRRRVLGPEPCPIHAPRCEKCGHLWGAYEDWCHCGGEPCHNRGPCEDPRIANP